jgi:hypothetical protein
MILIHILGSRQLDKMKMRYNDKELKVVMNKNGILRNH